MAVKTDRRSIVEKIAGTITRILEEPTFDPAGNLDRESAYLRELTSSCFRIWRNEDCVVLGRFLDAGKEVNLARASDLGIPVLKRESGGGAVFHDLGNINYSIYLHRADIEGIGIEESVLLLSYPVTRTLDILGIEWSWNPRAGILVHGRKISGVAQACRRNCLLHHGTFLIDTNLENMDLLLRNSGRSNCVPTVNLIELIPGITVREVTRIVERFTRDPRY